MSFLRDYEYFIVDDIANPQFPAAPGDIANTDQNTGLVGEGVAPQGAIVILGGCIRISGNGADDLRLFHGDGVQEYFDQASGGAGDIQTPTMNLSSGGEKLHHGLAAQVGGAAVGSTWIVYYRVLRAPLS